MLVPDTAWQNTYAGPVVIHCNLLLVIVTYLDLREVYEVRVILAIAFL